MKKQKFDCQARGLCLLLPVILFFSSIYCVRAQNGTYYKPSKYELSIDLIPVIDEGQFGKIYFKIKQFNKDTQEKGAFRLGVSKGQYFRYDDDMSTFPEETTTSLNNFSHFDMDVFVGYEKYKKIGTVLIYYGLDITGMYFKEHRAPETRPDQQIITLGICPFWGIKHYLLKNRVSVSFETGWENSLSKNTNQYNGQVFYYTLSKFQLPYTLAINYHF